MAADAPLARAPLLWRQPPAGSPLTPAMLARERVDDLAGALAARLGANRVDLVASGREALRRGLAAVAAESGRDEVVIPAYTCYSVAAAAVAAGLRVRLVDVTPRGAIDAAALERLPLERAAAVVVCNLFGVPEPVTALAQLCDAAGAALVDDAAQTLGAATAEGPVGGRGSLGVLSFARGKPLAALGGGALVWSRAPRGAPPAAPRPRRLRAALLALAHDIVLSPLAFGWVAALPGLHVGETRFESDFARGEISGESLALAQARLARLETENAERARRAEQLAVRIAETTDFEPLLAPSGQGVYPRLALLAPDPARRDAALARLLARGLGASGMYPQSLDALPALAPHRTDGEHCPEARRLAARILTVSVGPALGERAVSRLVAAL